MTLEKFCSFFENKEPWYEVTKQFIDDGYGQKKGGYIAKGKGLFEGAVPDQRRHLLESYYNVDNKDKDAKRCYNYLLCPELLLWIAEASGFEKDKVRKIAESAKETIDNGTNGRARNKAGRNIRKKIKWEDLEKNLIEKA